MAHLVLDRQLVAVRARVAAVARTLGVERADVRPVALVRRVLAREALEELLAGAVGLAELELARRAFFLGSLDCEVVQEDKRMT